MLLVRTAIPLLLISLFTAPSCKRLDVEPDTAKAVKVIGHGGVGFQSPRNQLPHNSLQSAAKAIEFYGAHGVEVDVQMSKSGTLWMYHDLSLETQSDCFGCIIQKTDEELAQCRFKNDVQVNVWNAPFYLTPVDELIARIKNFSELPYLIIDVRSAPICEDMTRDSVLAGTTRGILRARREFGNNDRLYFILRDRALTEKVKKENPEIQILFEAPFNSDNLEFAKQNDVAGLSFNRRAIEKSDVDYMREQGFEVCLFGAKSQSSIAATLNQTPEFIITDNIPLTLSALGSARD